MATATQPQTQTPERTSTGTPPERTRSRHFYRPNVDIIERTEELTILADMPGAHPDQIDINFENGVLTINGRVEKRLPEGASVLHCEYGVGDFFRSFQLGETIDPERITAEYKDGVLTVHLPKTEAAKPRKISVRTQ